MERKKSIGVFCCMGTRLTLDEVKKMVSQNPAITYTVQGGGELGHMKDLQYIPNPTPEQLAEAKEKLKNSKKQLPNETENIQQQNTKEQKKKNPKYRNRKVYIYEDGYIGNNKLETELHGKIKCVYDSQKEYQRWLELQMLQRTGAISNLKRQVKYILQPDFKYNGKKIRAIAYNADFQFSRDGKEIVEDVKGIDRKTKKPICTKDFKLKWKMLKYKYPNIMFEIY